MIVKKPSKKPIDQYIRYTSIAFQMALIIAGGVYGGVLLDQWLAWGFPVFALVFSMLSVGIAIYLSIRDFLKKS